MMKIATSENLIGTITTSETNVVSSPIVRMIGKEDGTCLLLTFANGTTLRIDTERSFQDLVDRKILPPF